MTKIAEIWIFTKVYININQIQQFFVKEFRIMHALEELKSAKKFSKILYFNSKNFEITTFYTL